MRIATFVSVLAVTSLLGCRTVWVHPEASQEKYASDFYRCRFGAEPPTNEQIHAGALPSVSARPDWEQCMGLLGWTPEVGMRWSESYSR